MAAGGGGRGSDAEQGEGVEAGDGCASAARVPFLAAVVALGRRWRRRGARRRDGGGGRGGRRRRRGPPPSVRRCLLRMPAQRAPIKQNGGHIIPALPICKIKCNFQCLPASFCTAGTLICIRASPQTWMQWSISLRMIIQRPSLQFQIVFGQTFQEQRQEDMSTKANDVNPLCACERFSYFLTTFHDPRKGLQRSFTRMDIFI